MRVQLASIFLAYGVPLCAHATTFNVVNTFDAGAGSLRQAILDSNASIGPDDIQFAIPGSGVHTIALASALPPITDPVILDGYSQAGSSPNTLPAGQGLNTVLTIEIDGTGAGSNPCLTINAGNGDFFVMSVQGLVINRCAGKTILVGPGGDGAFISGNFIGTDPTGASRPGGFNNLGIQVDGASGVAVGGSTPFERNLIACFDGFSVGFQNSTGSAVRGNLIGTNAAGAAIVPASPGVANTGVSLSATGTATVGGSSESDANVIVGFAHGIFVSGNGNASVIRRNRIGTDTTGAFVLGNGVGVDVFTGSAAVVQENVISGNGEGMFVANGSSPLIVGNFIGTDTSASLDLGNSEAGIIVFNASGVIGGVAAGEGNTIEFNGTTGLAFSGGILVAADEAVTMRGNRILANANIGIDLDGDGVTPNDPFDSDTGSNGLQNYPLITSVAPGASTTHIEGAFIGSASASFDVDLFASPECRARPLSPLDADLYLGAVVVTTDGTGHATFAVDVPFVLAAGQRVTGTATDANGHTSELSPGILLSLDPPSGPPAGGVASTLDGMLFEAGATVSVGGTPATNVNVMNDHTITATMPARPAGSVNDVVVTNLDGTTGTVVNGWLANFLDVPGGQQFYDFVVTLVRNGISGGIGGGVYGVDGPTLRQQMAVFLLKGEHGICFAPPPCTGVFADVPCSSPFAPWIEALADEGITGGCGAGNFCPTNPVRRDQMAVFLLKAKHGSSYVPPACSGTFPDVGCPSLFADWIEQLAMEGITSGCGNGNYCPLANVTRGQMAVFVTRTFRLQ